jgi:hypothetical protein
LKPINEAAAAGRVDFLTTLASLLERCRGLLRNAERPDLLKWTTGHLTQVLALTPGRACVESLLSGWRSATHDPGAIRRLAAQLASGQAPDVLLAALEEHAGEEALFELWACVLQELVLRGANLAGRPVVERQHPLAALPLYLRDAEKGLAAGLPRYGYSSASWGTPVEHPPGSTLPLTSARPLPSLQDETDETSRAQIGEAVQNWQHGSNGEVEIRVFHAASPLTSEERTASLLASLGLECLAGADAQTIRAREIPLGRALEILFSAACNGCAYNQGMQGAYGRLATWRSVAGLVGAAPRADIESVAHQAERCVWLTFDPTSDWFYELAWDLAVIAVRADGMSLAVLAATDTD